MSTETAGEVLLRVQVPMLRTVAVMCWVDIERTTKTAIGAVVVFVGVFNPFEVLQVLGPLLNQTCP